MEADSVPGRLGAAFRIEC